jgi:hypothetical protein
MLKTSSIRALLITVTAGIFLYLWIDSALVAQRGAGFDLTPRYIGAQAFWEGRSPYAPDVTRAIQERIFQRLLDPDEDQQGFAYPAYTAMLIAPLLLLPLEPAASVWITLQVLALLWAIWLWVRLLGWEARLRIPAVGGALILVLFTLGFTYPITFIGRGQFTGGVFLCLTLGIWLLARPGTARVRQDVWAGVCFAIASIQPTLSVPIGAVIAGVLLLRGRWGAAAGMVGMTAALSTAAMLWIGFWIPDFISGLVSYSGYAPFFVWLPRLLPAPLDVLWLGGGAALLIGLVWRAWHDEASTSQTAVGLYYSVTALILLILPQTGSYFLMLLIPHLVLGAASGRTGLRLAVGGVLVASWVLLLFPWEVRRWEALLMPLAAWAIAWAARRGGRQPAG